MEIRPATEQRDRSLCSSKTTCFMKWGHPQASSGMKIRPAIEQRDRHLFASNITCFMQWSPPVAISCVKIRPTIDQSDRLLCFALFACRVKCGLARPISPSGASIHRRAASELSGVSDAHGRYCNNSHPWKLLSTVTRLFRLFVLPLIIRDSIAIVVSCAFPDSSQHPSGDRSHMLLRAKYSSYPLLFAASCGAECERCADRRWDRYHARCAA